MSKKVGANHSEQLKLKKFGEDGADVGEVSRALNINKTTCRAFMHPDVEDEPEVDEDEPEVDEDE